MLSTPAHPHKRRLVPIVDRQFQYKYTGMIVAVAAVISSVLAWQLFRSYQELNEILEINQAINAALNSADAMRVFYISMGFIVAEVVLLGLVGLLITHRVVGPVFVLERHFGTVLDGKYPKIRPLRQHDEFKSAFETFSHMITTVKQRDEEELQALRKILADLDAGGAVPPEHRAALVSVIDAKAARIRDE